MNDTAEKKSAEAEKEAIESIKKEVDKAKKDAIQEIEKCKDDAIGLIGLAEKRVTASADIFAKKRRYVWCALIPITVIVLIPYLLVWLEQGGRIVKWEIALPVIVSQVITGAICLALLLSRSVDDD